MDQGAKSNVTGNQLEAAVKTVLTGKGFQHAKFRDWENAPLIYGTELLLENVPFKTIYGHRGHTEFLLISEKYGLRTRIECKWQQVSGSVDEKLPYLYLNAIEAMPEKSIMILIDGPGWKAGAIKWLKDAIRNTAYMNNEKNKKDILVLSLSEFFAWANNTFNK